ncbi:cyclohexanone monooxygenase [Aulographum hederae CBS 113979]|uniref:Cyclohexanone monooxygenase n=1 Tax=Aulographum hederae CBS 113979 TaxID=1176131 RepID=A0A6G1H978_9PEZI|nr:cyclohexanone monooxygenase [Aulographum hederae CBS 113979]
MATQSESTLDALIIGTGFSGVYLLHKLLKLNYNVIALDAASQLGGVWCHNNYPGAGVDIPVPDYQYGMEEVWNPSDGKNWTWSEKFPQAPELRRYFQYADEKMGGLSKHCEFGTWVEGAVWSDGEKMWEVKASNGKTWKTKFLLPSLGYAAKPVIPTFPGLNSFEGVVVHTSKWPEKGIDLEGKRVGVIGTGASGIQVIQTIAPEVQHLTVFQRTPAMAIPIQQKPYDPASSGSSIPETRQFFQERKTMWDGSHSDMIMRSALTDTPAQREENFSRLWDAGGFSFWTSNYMDLFSSPEANDLIYAYWKQRVRERVNDPQTAHLLAPDRKPHHFGTKRAPLESTYYDTFNSPNVSLIDLIHDPVAAITPTGIQLASGKSHDLDVLVLATGFDVATGPFTQLDLRGRSGVPLSEQWKDGCKTYLGMSVHDFPNMLFPYGPQSPATVCNGPVCAEAQGEFIIGLLETMREKEARVVEPQKEPQAEWTELVTGLLKGSLFEETTSFYWGENVKGKAREPVLWFGGVPGYLEKCEGARRDGWRGFTME